MRSIEAAIEEKFHFGAELRAMHARRTRDNTETNWKPGAELRSGPFSFSYRYQRADLAVTGPFPYGSPERFGSASVREPIYTCSGMAAISVVLLAIADTSDEKQPAFLHLAGAYKETLELAATIGFRTVCLVGANDGSAAHEHQSILWLDDLPCGERAIRLRVPGAQLAHVRTLRSLADSRDLIARAHTGRLRRPDGA